MENIWLVVFLVFIGWHVVALRKDIRVRDVSTTLFLSIDSDEDDGPGLPVKSAHLLRKVRTPFAVVPGMELADSGSMNLQVVRVVFEDNARGVYLKSKRVPLSQLDDTVRSFVKSGWQDRS